MSPSPEIQELISKLEDIGQETIHADPHSRVALLAAAQKLCLTLETPLEFIQRIMFQEPTFLFGIRFAYDTQLFRLLGAQNNPPQTVESLAEQARVEPELLKRVLRHLAARHVLTEQPTAGLGSYGPTHISEVLATPEASTSLRAISFKHHSFNFYQDFMAMPSYLSELGYRSPTNTRDGPFQRSVGLAGNTFAECLEMPALKSKSHDFKMVLQLLTQGQASYLDVCDLGAQLEKRPPKTDGSKLFLDLGGGIGTNAVHFRTRFRSAPGAVEVQELETVVKSAQTAGIEDHGVELRIHDLFDPQPVNGARFYFMSIVLHDFPDSDAKQLLDRVAAAMEKGYSTLLISEIILPDHGCPPNLSAMDLNIMTYLAGRERSESDWRHLLEGAGLKLVKVHTTPTSARSVLECEL